MNLIFLTLITDEQIAVNCYKIKNFYPHVRKFHEKNPAFVQGKATWEQPSVPLYLDREEPCTIISFGFEDDIYVKESFASIKEMLE